MLFLIERCWANEIPVKLALRLAIDFKLLGKRTALQSV
jgi:hypothetical protein